ncbi:PAS and ANTAR domain-containing protein [Isoptericola aurantiacus]|uniref:PAS and ANTAR domain-containing protein n=1 Tax=Isoptericola aurantiacus TaxID=3377839 RepID=UPI003839E626
MSAPTSSHRTVRGGTGLSGIAESLAVGAQLVVGRYRVDVASGRTWWSDEVYRMHGREPGDVEPSLDVLRSRIHPDDRARLSRTAGVALRTGRPFGSGFRIVDSHGKSRTVVVTGEGRHEPDGEITQVGGYVLDASPLTREALERESHRAVGRAMAATAAVEQVKGAIMVVRGISEPAAADVLSQVAARKGVAVHSAAAQVMEALGCGEGPSAERLENALAAVHVVDRPRGHEAQLARRRQGDRD